MARNIDVNSNGFDKTWNVAMHKFQEMLLLAIKCSSSIFAHCYILKIRKFYGIHLV